MAKAKFLAGLMLAGIAFSACSQQVSDEAIQTAIAKTKEASESGGQTQQEQATLSNPTETATQTQLPSSTIPPTWTLTPTITLTSEPTSTPGPGTRGNPVPFGQAAEPTLNGNIRYSINLVEVYRGDEAWRRVYAANMFNEEPPTGLEYVLAFIHIEFIEGPADSVLEMDYRNFNTISNGQIMENSLFIVEPSPEFDVSLFPGGTANGWITFVVQIGDPNPLLVVGFEEGADTPIYFALTP